MNEILAGILWHPLGRCAIHCLRGHDHLGDIVVWHCQIIKHTICCLLSWGRSFKNVCTDPSDGGAYESWGDFFHGPMMLLWWREGREGGIVCTWSTCWPPDPHHSAAIEDNGSSVKVWPPEPLPFTTTKDNGSQSLLLVTVCWVEQGVINLSKRGVEWTKHKHKNKHRCN